MKKLMMISIGVVLLAGASAQDRMAEINQVLAAPPSQVHSVRAGDVRLGLQGIYVLDGLLWFSIRVSNGSVIDWHGSPMRFSIRDNRVWRRRARQEVPLAVIARREVSVVRSDSTVMMCYGLIPRLPRKGQNLVLEYAERNGDRRMVLRLKRKELLRARKLVAPSQN